MQGLQVRSAPFPVPGLRLMKTLLDLCTLPGLPTLAALRIRRAAPPTAPGGRSGSAILTPRARRVGNRKGEVRFRREEGEKRPRKGCWGEGSGRLGRGLRTDPGGLPDWEGLSGQPGPPEPWPLAVYTFGSGESLLDGPTSGISFPQGVRRTRRRGGGPTAGSGEGEECRKGRGPPEGTGRASTLEPERQAEKGEKKSAPPGVEEGGGGGPGGGR